MAATSKAKSRAPYVNLFDLPELMPGAQPSANPAQREEFEQRCRQLHRDEEKERLERQHEQSMTAAAREQASVSELQAMFPTLDADLIRVIHAEAPTPQEAVETLLALSVDDDQPRAATPPPLDMGMDDHEKFPVLTDAEGWQVVSQKLIDGKKEEDLGSAWCDRAKAVQHMPAAPVPQPAAPLPKRKAKKEESKEVEEDDILETDYDFRHRIGQNRAKARARFGRGAGRGNATRQSTEAEDEEEASVDGSSCTDWA
ncbi:unnamed protein product [Effrenium voratum]|uniref:CUE domain-containing protein n=1 Tax=Effrenium voratum TaxID=2562239 RepID=A0AA36N671_9DINO|nr:unnamed protein product [Effrenium voratum]